VNKQMQKPDAEKLRNRKALISTASVGKKLKTMETIVSTLLAHKAHTRDAIRSKLHRCAATCCQGALGASLFLAGVPHTQAAETYTTVVTWGLQSTVPAGLTGVIDIAAGAFHNLALKADGTVVGWGVFSFTAGGIGYNYGQQSVPAGLSGVIGIAGGDFHSLALKSDGTVVAWGGNNDGQCNVPAGLANVTAVAAGGTQSLALKSDGTVVSWGLDGWRAVLPELVTPPAGLSDVMAIDAGIYHTVALESNGTVVVWGPAVYADNTAPAGLSGVIAIAAGDNHTLALKSDGTVVAWGYNNYGQTAVPNGLTNVIAIAAGAYHNAAIITVTVSTQESITNLEANIQALVNAGILKSGQAGGLIQPLDNALRSLAKGKPADACNQVVGFVSDVVAMTPNPLNAATAANLIAAAKEICSSIGCK
jgi:hypothetical protein